MRRNFPFVLQHDSMQCGVACLAMICSYFKKDKSIFYTLSRNHQCKGTDDRCPSRHNRHSL
ncbi:MAG: cysteine peptidase family C39 domain-containing protein [Prevotella sp.]|nr:cysteine peptidase family C39 domain-containing protein [Prevotella sp.]